MKYQFEIKKPIARCRECPMCEWGETFDDYDRCGLSDRYLFPDRDRPDDCPLIEA